MKYPNFKFENRLWKRGFKIVAGADEVGRGCFAGPVVAGCVSFPQVLNSKLQMLKKEIRIDDSKKLTNKQRGVAEKWIKENSLAWGIGEASVSEINRLGMTKATSSAFRRAVANANIRLHSRIEYLLVDAFFIPYTRGLPIGKNKQPRIKPTLRFSRKFSKSLFTASLHPRAKSPRISQGLNKGVRGHRNPKIDNLRGRQTAIINGDEKSISIAAASILAKVYRDKLMISLSENLKFKKYGWDTNKGYGTKKHRMAIVRYGIIRHHRKMFVETFLTKQKSK